MYVHSFKMCTFLSPVSSLALKVNWNFEYSILSVSDHLGNIFNEETNPVN